MKIYNEDCLTGMKRLADSSIDFICTDLPYGMMSYKQDKKINLAEMWQEFKRILKPRCVVALFASSRFTIELAASNLEWYKYKFVWVKNFSTNFINAKNRPMTRYEEILIFSNGVCVHANQSDNRMKYYPQGLKKIDISYRHSGSTICMSSGKHIYNKNAKKEIWSTIHSSPSNVEEYTQQWGNYPNDVLYFDAPYNVGRAHPNEKPIPLLEYLIRTYSDEGEVVLDATCGSGSCGVACVNTNRNFIGYELDKKYYDVASERINKAVFEKSTRLF